jgi:hypothetical protein
MNGEFVKGIADKIILSLAVTILSTLVLVGYNSYSKTFDAAQTDARPMSNLFVKLRNEVIDASFQALKEVRSAYSDAGASALKIDKIKKVRDEAAEIGRLSTLFQGNATETYDSGIALSRKLRKWLTTFEQANNFTDQNIETFDKEVTEATIKFLNSSEKEYSHVVMVEFNKFFDQYYSNVPIYARPGCLLLITSIVLVGTIAVLFFLPPDKKLSQES